MKAKAKLRPSLFEILNHDGVYRKDRGGIWKSTAAALDTP